MKPPSRWTLLAAALLVVACGSPPQREQTGAGASSGSEDEEQRTAAVASDADYRSGPPPVVEVTATSSSVAPDAVASSDSSGEAMSTELPPNLGSPPAREPAPLALVGYAIVPDRATRVLLASLELPPGRRFVPPVSSCQDVLVYLAEGTLDASGTGIASVSAPATMYPGDAVRFGPEGDGLIVNATTEPVRTLVAIARREDAGPARLAPEERSDRLLCTARRTQDTLVSPLRVASWETTPVLSSRGTAIEARILLDADAAGAEHAGLAVLTAGADAAITEHVHDGAAEVLYVEDGEGTMQIGDRTVAVHPGTSLYVPAGQPHAFTPSGARPLRLLQFYAPSGPEQRLRGTGS